MFTGLVQVTGTVASLADGRLAVEADAPLELAAGDSVSVNGVCLTATEVSGPRFGADVMEETLRRSALGTLEPGATVNLELPLRAADRLGGHVVQGHVDGIGTVESVTSEGFARVVRVAAPAEVLRYVVDKGSIALDGVSLTAFDVDSDGFSVSLVPETLERTSLRGVEPGRRVNLEVDVLAKYVEKLVESDRGTAGRAGWFREAGAR
jgi:riboflavin synthase